MRYIQHRVNTAAALSLVPAHRGVEVDIRDFGDRLVLRHDPFGDGENVGPYLASCRIDGPVIFNIKSERTELRVLELLQVHPVKDYFFLDCSFPMIRLLSSRGERRVAVRFSEFEPLEAVMAARDMASWVWVDCFSRMPMDARTYAALRRHFRICVVSPELQGRPPEGIPEFAESLLDFLPDAVCTKYPDRWAALGGEFSEPASQ